VKGFKALGNQLTTEKIKQVNILESLLMKFRKKFFLNAEAQMMMGQIFNEMKTANHIYLIIDIKAFEGSFLCQYYFYFFFWRLSY
jgi:hypothetical protein